MKILAPIVGLFVVLSLASCGGSSSTGATTTAKQVSAASSESKGRDDVQEAPPVPHVKPPPEPPPDHLVIKDLVKGTGKPIKANHEFSVRYVSFNYETGEMLEDHWGNDSIFTWTFGPHEVVSGWAKGLPGMRVGGRRELIAPPRLAYGYPMIWVVELLSVGSE